MSNCIYATVYIANSKDFMHGYNLEIQLFQHRKYSTCTVCQFLFVKCHVIIQQSSEQPTAQTANCFSWDWFPWKIWLRWAALIGVFFYTVILPLWHGNNRCHKVTKVSCNNLFQKQQQVISTTTFGNLFQEVFAVLWNWSTYLTLKGLMLDSMWK